MNKVHIATYQEAAKRLAETLPKVNHKVVVRLGGQMPYEQYDLHINSAKAIQNSVNKLAQKTLLLKANLATLPLLPNPDYPCVVKGIVRSGGTKVFVVETPDQFAQAERKLDYKYLIEPLFKATSEYRLHCSRDEVFFMVKKIKRNPADIIITAANHFNKRDFVKPRLLNEIKAECLKAMAALDLDIACFDVMYDSSNNEKHRFVIAEANTNPELLENTFQAYNKKLTEIIQQKIKELPNKKPVPKPPKAAAEQEPALIDNTLTEQQLVAIIRNLMDKRYDVETIDRNHVTLTFMF